MKNEIKVNVVIAPQTPQPAPVTTGGYTFMAGQWYIFGDKSGVFCEMSPGKAFMLGKTSGPIMCDTVNIKTSMSKPPIPVTVSFHFEEPVDVDA